MKRTLVAAALCAGLSLAFPGTAAADPMFICPDEMVPVPAAFLPKGDVQDKNGNGIVCVKFIDGEFRGGPDDHTDDIVL